MSPVTVTVSGMSVYSAGECCAGSRWMQQPLPPSACVESAARVTSLLISHCRFCATGATRLWCWRTVVASCAASQPSTPDSLPATVSEVSKSLLAAGRDQSPKPCACPRWRHKAAIQGYASMCLTSHDSQEDKTGLEPLSPRVLRVVRDNAREFRASSAQYRARAVGH